MFVFCDVVLANDIHYVGIRYCLMFSFVRFKFLSIFENIIIKKVAV